MGVAITKWIAFKLAMPYAPGRFFCTSGGTCYHSFEDHCIPGCALPLRGTKP